MRPGADRELLTRFFSHPKLEFLLKGWGFFLRDMSLGTVISHRLWSELGYEPEQFLDNFWTTLLHPEDRVRVIPKFEELRNGGADFLETEFRLRDATMNWHWIRHRSIVLERDSQKVPTLFVGFDQDVTSDKERLSTAEHSLRFYERRFWETESLRVAGSVLAGGELDPVVAVERFLHQASRFLPYDAAAVWGLMDDELEWLGGNGLERGDLTPLNLHPGLYEPLAKERRPLLLTDLAFHHPNRFQTSDQQFRGWLGLPLVHHDTVVGFVEFLTMNAGSLHLDHLAAVSSLADPAAVALHNARKFRKTEDEAMLDPLTGLLTRRSFERSAELLRTKIDVPLLALLVLDLDHFKKVNDVWGHKAGDSALQGVSSVCRKLVREGDLVCRWGGEEILILLKGSGPSEARRAAERIRREVGRTRFDDFDELSVTASLGVVTFPPEAPGTLAEWFEKADRALYRAKTSGRNCVQVWHEPRDRRNLGE